jgi:Secretion system C-terminal sorting domain
MKSLKYVIYLIFCISLSIPENCSAQNEIKSNRFKEMHDETSCDPYLPNTFKGKKVSPAYKYSSSKANARIAASNINTVQVNVDANGQNIIGDAANETSIAVNPLNGGEIVIGWRQFDNVTSNFRQAGWSFTTDSGQTWTFPGVLEPGIFRSDPVLDFDANGNFYYNSLTNNPDFFCKVFKSIDGGATWDSGVDAAGGDKQWMAIDRTSGAGNGNIYSFWSSFASTCIPSNSTRSTDNGFTFDPCVFVDGDPFWGTMAVNNSGELFITGRSQTTDSILVIKSPDAQIPASSITWSVAQVDMDGVLNAGPVVNPGGLPGQVNIDIDLSNGPGAGNIYICAPLERISNGDPGDIMFSGSQDGGVTWSAPVKINDDVSINNTQWFGTMSVAPNGRIDICWLDTRDAPALSDSSALYYSYSLDQGNTWSVNEKLSPNFDPHVGYPNQNKLGDYFDMVSDNTGAHLAWANTLNGEQDAYYSRIIPSIPSSVANNSGVPPLLLIPNPVIDIFEIKGDFTTLNIAIYSAIGEVVYKALYLPNEPINISNIASGIYLLKAKNDEGSTVIKKLIKN